MFTPEFNETFIVAFTSLFALIDPIGTAVIFASLTPTRSAYRRRVYAVKGVVVALIILLIFMFLGEFLLNRLGISLAAMRTSGGILLLILGIDMVFARHSGGTSTTDEEEEEALARGEAKEDISVFPLATPLIAGPGAIGAVLLLHANTKGVAEQQLAVLLALGAILLASLLSLLASTFLQNLLGKTGLNVINRIMGVLLAALAVQFVFDGLAQSGIFS
ncbi:MAG: MarC family protein [Arenicellales bacterium]